MFRPVSRWLLALLLLSGSTRLSAQAGTIILVRHAEKVSPSGDPVLSAPGQDRARDLVRALEPYHLDLIITSQYRRTQLTAQPAATARHLTPVVVPVADSIMVYAAQLAARLDRMPRGSTVLIVGHSNTLGLVISALGGPAVPDLCDSDFSTMFVLFRPAGDSVPRLLRTSYGRPAPTPATGCP
ncbi:MAG: phosphoglycerate mutase family protein [Gemmatimonadota bacterium]